MQSVDGVQAESGSQHPIERGGTATPLHMTEDGGACLLSGSLGDLGLQQVPDAREPDVSEGVHFAPAQWHGALQGKRTFGNHHDRCVVAGEPMLDEGAHRPHVEGTLRYEDHVGAPCQS